MVINTADGDLQTKSDINAHIHGGPFMQAASTLAEKALRSMSRLMSSIKCNQAPVYISFNFFDSCVLSILNNNSVVWDFINAEELERVQRKFCKCLINDKRSTNTLSFYSKLGRFPLFVERHIRMVKYFLKLHGIKRDNCILNAVLMEELKDIGDRLHVIN